MNSSTAAPGTPQEYFAYSGRQMWATTPGMLSQNRSNRSATVKSFTTI
jgi:hypothetical protein